MSDLPQRLDDHGIRRTAVIFVGKVLDPATPTPTDSYLYSHARMTKLRSGGHDDRPSAT